MIVARRVFGEILSRENSDGVFGCAVSNASSVFGDLSRRDVVRCLSSDEETIVSNDSVGSESRALGADKRTRA